MRLLLVILVGLLLSGLGRPTAERSLAAALPIPLVFDGGDPGTPGDGVFVQLPPGESRFILREPIPASGISAEHFTVAVFTSADDRIASITAGIWALDGSGSCKGAVYIGGGDVGTITLDTVSGTYQVFNMRLAYESSKFAACHLTKDDLFIGEILLANDSRSLRPQDYLITKIDAAYLGLDAGVYPGESSPGQ